jgi:hypothetical protein
MSHRFPLHLCQPDAGKSCAACCGIYNFIDNDRSAAVARLRANSRAVAEAGCSDRVALCRHADRMRPAYNGPAKRFATIFNCEYVGFLNREETRVGCLLHPARQDGDLRGLSFYGAELCRDHFCLSYYYLTQAEQQLVINTVDDWYLYGLVITDIDLVKGLFEAVSNRLGEAIKPQCFFTESLKERVAGFFRWKLTWPFRSTAANRFGKYRFSGEYYEEARIPYELWERVPSPYHPILLALGSELRTAAELDQAESLLDRAIDDVVRAYRKRVRSSGLDQAEPSAKRSTQNPPRRRKPE